MGVLHDDAARVAEPYLARALELAEKGRGTTSPNPVVGCVIVHEGIVVGEGYHERAGGPHAERNALAMAGNAARGATAFVTLEPCNHHGKTPPCVEALIEAGVARVVIGMRDPNPTVAGDGASALQAAGVAVEFAPDPRPFERQNEAWLTWLTFKRPWIRVKTAVTLDAKTSLGAGARTHLSGPQARALTMRLRAQADAVAVGAVTARIDNPRLTVRDAEDRDAARQPLRIVLSRAGAPDVGLFHDGAGPAIVMAQQGTLSAAPPGVEVVTYPKHGGLSSAMEVLGARGVTHLLIEAGGKLLTALSNEGLIDELVVYHVGRMAGVGAPGIWELPASAGMSCDTDRMRMGAVEAGVIGDDAVTVWRPIAPTV